MSEAISTARLAEITAYERETRDGPWILADANDGDGTPPMWVLATSEAQNDDCDWAVHIHVGDKGVGEFIAMARTAVPELLAEVDRLTRELDQARQHVDELQDKLASMPDIGKCCCSFEGPGDICNVHSPTVNRLAARVADLEAAIDRVMKMPMHAHNDHWCSSSRDFIRALGDVAPAPSGEAIARLLSGLAERTAAPDRSDRSGQ